MTGDAIVHRQRLERSWRRTIERFHGSMARLTGELDDCDVDAMGEKHVRRQAPHALPGNLLRLLAIGLEFLYLGIFGSAARMTSQTKNRGRPAGHEIFLSALVAACACHVSLDMWLMLKLDGLLDGRCAPIERVRERQSSNKCRDQDSSFQLSVVWPLSRHHAP